MGSVYRCQGGAGEGRENIFRNRNMATISRVEVVEYAFYGEGWYAPVMVGFF